MTIEQLSLATLGEISEGQIREDFDSLLARLIEDCTSRPAVKKARVLTIKCGAEAAPRRGRHVLGGGLQRSGARQVACTRNRLAGDAGPQEPTWANARLR